MDALLATVPGRLLTRTSQRRIVRRMTKRTCQAKTSYKPPISNPMPSSDPALNLDLIGYTIYLHVDLRPHRVWPWWATMTHGSGNIGEAGGGVWRARTQEKLIAKCKQWITKDMLRRGQTGDANIRVLDPR